MRLEDKLQTVLNRLDSHSGGLVYDCETSGLDWRFNHVCGHVISFGPLPSDSYYIPVRHAAGGNVGGKGPVTATGWDGKLARGEKELLSRIFRKGRQITGHNVSFDAKFAYRLIGVQAFEPQFFDTMINEPLLNEFAGKFSLEACCLRHGVQPKLASQMYAHLRQKFPEIKSDREAMGHFWRLAGDDPMAVEYATGDGTSTWQLRDAQRVKIEEQISLGRDRNGQERFTDLTRVHGIESRLIRVLARMTCKGIRVDVGYFEELKHKLDLQIRQMLEIFPDPGNASAQAPSDVKWYLEKCGVTDWPLTPKTRKPSFPEKWLETHQPGRDIIKIRHLTHLRNTFVNPLLESHIWNGRVHCNFNQLRNDEYGTITGRLSCDSPNLQQVPKRDHERSKMLRTGFIPDSGMLFSDVDYSQAEPRILAHYSRCKVLLDGYRNDPEFDAHTGVTRAMNLSKGYDDWDKATKKAAREVGKRINQTLVTGGGRNAIVTKYGVAPNEVDQQYRDYFRAMPEIKTLQHRAALLMKQRGFVVSLLGRRSKLLDPNKAYIAVNRLLQPGNADVLKSKMVEIDDYLDSEGRPPVDVLCNCHDALNFQFDPAHRAVYNECLAIMVRFGPDDLIPLDVPMKVEPGEGKNWSEATFGAE